METASLVEIGRRGVRYKLRAFHIYIYIDNLPFIYKEPASLQLKSTKEDPYLKFITLFVLVALNYNSLQFDLIITTFYNQSCPELHKIQSRLNNKINTQDVKI